MRNSRTCFVLAMLALLACGPSGEIMDSSDAGATELIVTPADAELVVLNGVVQTQSFKVEMRDGDSLVDVTDQVAWSLENPTIGSFAGSTFQSATLAGRSLARATLDVAQGSASITVRVIRETVEDGVSADAPSWFDSASEDPALAASIVYPENGTLVPPNLGDFEAHWTPQGGADVFRLSIRSELVDIVRYTTGAPGNGGVWAALAHADFRVLAISALGKEVTVEVRALHSASPQSVGTSEPISVKVSEEDVNGGLYYWASTGAQPGGIYRHDMAEPMMPAEAFYTTSETPDARCVACHVLSRAGDRMAVTFDGGNGSATILDVASKSPMTDTSTLKWNFAAFTADGSRLLTVHQGQMFLRDGNSAAVLAPVQASGWPTHPDFSPSDNRLVYVRAQAPTTDWVFGGGQLVVRSFDPTTNEFGPETLLLKEANANIYYPSFSPDGNWIVFSRSTEDAYDDATAELYAIRADGTGTPVLLAAPNLAAGLTNSWARWAPFQQTATTDSGDSEPLFWFTFSSKRAFGVRLPAGQPQLWMAPFYPGRAATDPSAPAFRLPFQSIATNNHIAQWTEEVVPID